ncbi:MAG: hypothetical protein U0531_17940 [Dehalococcoidia bacterium]
MGAAAPDPAVSLRAYDEITARIASELSVAEAPQNGFSPVGGGDTEEESRAHVLLRLLTFLGPYPGRVALAVTCMLGAAALVLIQPQLIGRAVQLGVDGGDDLTAADPGGAAVLGASVLRGAFAFGQSYWERAVATSPSTSATRCTIACSGCPTPITTRRRSSIMSRATQDVEGVRIFVSMGLLRLIYALVLLFTRWR